jgi:phosphate transport system substrate-binding protein
VTSRMRIAAPLPLGSLLLVSSLLLLASACAPQPVNITREPVTLRLVAADSLAPLAEGVASGYEETRPWVTVSTEVLNAAVAESVLRQGGADLALLSWLKEPEGEGQLWTAGFARDAVAVIVHPASPLTETGLAELQEIFRGRQQEWSGTVLTIVSRESGSGTRAAFESIVLNGRDTTLNAVVMPSSEAMVEHVASTPGAVGYVSTLWLGQAASARSTQSGRPADGARVLPVEGGGIGGSRELSMALR